MQKLEIVFDEALEPQILMLLRQNGLEHYTRFDSVKGVGGAGAKFDTAVGPGVNRVVFCVVDDDKVPGFTRAFKRFKDVQGEHAGATLIVSTVSEFL